MLAMRIKKFRWIGRNCWALLAMLAMSHVAAAVPTPLQEKLLLVDVNHQKINETVVVLESDAGELYAASADLKRWRVRAPPLTEAIS